MFSKNKIAITRIFFSFAIMLILLFPLDTAGIQTTKLFINESIVVDIKYLLAGILFAIDSLLFYLDFYISKKKKMIQGNLNNIINKVLIDSTLIILTSQGFIQPIIPVVLIVRDCFLGNNFVDEIKIDKAKTLCLMLGITLVLFYNLPFELWNLRISEFLLIIATVLSIVSAFEPRYKKQKMQKQTNV